MKIKNVHFLNLKSMSRALLLLCFFVFMQVHGNAQNVGVTGADAATNVASPFATLSAAFVSINATSQSGNTIAITIINNTSEPVGGAILNAGTWTSVSIQPIGGAAKSISGAVTAGLPLIDFNGADNVTVDGLNTGGNSLTISNTTVSATSGTSTIRFIGGATNNIITNSNIQGSGTMAVGTNGATIFFSTDAITANGNDNNTISNCDIGPAGANLPTKAILGNGSTTTTAIGNSGNVITNNNIFDFFGAAVTSSGIATNGGCNTWTITNNRFYQTGTRTWTTGATHRAIDINNTSATSGAQGFTITGNIIGYSSNTQTGIYTLTGSTGKFQGIQFSGISLGTVSNVNSNTIASVSLTGVTSSGTSTSSPFIGILVSNGLANTNTNTIGSQSAVGSLVFSTNSTTSTDVMGIYNFSLDIWTSNNNLIGGISVTNAAASGTYIIYGLRANTGTSVAWTANSNLVGGTIANSIQLNATGTSCQVIGMHTSNAPASFTGNTIRNLTSNIGTGTTTSASLIGINVTTTTPNHTVSQNTIFNLSNTNITAATVVTGIQFTGSTANIVERNLIYGITSSTNSTGAEINGIRVAGGTTQYRNNMIRLGLNVTNAIGAAATNSSVVGINGINGALGTDQFFHNSVYIGGTADAGSGSSYAFNSTQTINTRSFRNNIFQNSRTNSTATGKHYAIKINGTTLNPTGLTLNNNVYFANGTGAVFGFFNSLDVANLTDWKTAVGQDAGSFESNPQFLDPTNSTPDLHINPSVTTIAEGNGFNLGVLADYDGQTRSGLTPVDIGADAGNFMGIDLSSPSITFTPLTFTCATGNRALGGVVITDASGVPISGSLQPRIYYRKNMGTWFSSQGSLASGTSMNGTWNFNIIVSDMGGVAPSDIIQYYVIAQDVASPLNIGSSPSAGLSATDVNTVTTPPTTPNSYTVNNTLSGTKTVGVGGDYTTLTAAVNAYNTSCLSGAVVFSLIDATYSGSETFPITILQNADASAVNTLTIRPAIGVVPIMTGSNSGAILRLNGADWVTLDGSNNGTESRDWTISNSNTGTSSMVIWVSSANSSDGATNNTFKNLIISGNASTTTFSCIISSGSATVGGVAEAANTNNSYINNRIFASQYGIGLVGPTVNETGTVVRKNTIGSTVTAEKHGLAGIAIFQQQNVQVSENSVTGIIRTSSDNNAGGITVSGTISGGVINANTITDIKNTNSGGYAASGIRLSSSSAVTNLAISNNFISDVSAAGYDLNWADNAHGINVSTGGGYNIYFNTVNMATNQTNAGNSSALAIVNATATALNIRNNILVMAQTTGTRYAIYSASAASAFTQIDNNDYVSSGSIGFLTLARTTLSDWQTATSKDVNSISIAPVFVSATNLRLLPASNTSLFDKGINIVGITKDIEGETRHASMPDIGADEFSFITLNLTAFIEGYMVSPTSMRPVLMNSGIVGANATQCDTLKVELYSSALVLLGSFTGVLNTDGTMVCKVPSQGLGGNNYIVLKHRNGLETWSGNGNDMPTSFPTLTASYNFSTAANQAYGSNMKNYPSSGVFAMYSGDIDRDGEILPADYTIWLISNTAGDLGYKVSDLDGDGEVLPADYTIWRINNTAGIFKIVP